MPRIDYDSIAEIYDLYAVADYDIPFFVSQARQVHGRVLELMAGTGRVSVPLLEAGVRLTCVDASSAMLRVLAAKLKQRGLDAEVHCADIRTLGLPADFELAILPFNSFSELLTPEDQRSALESVHACLVPSGQFICTLHNPAIRAAHVDGVLRLTGRFPTADGFLLVSGLESGGDPVVTRLQFFEFYGLDNRLTSKRVLEMRFSLIERQAFETVARDAGFHVVHFYGDYKGGEFDPASSPSMIWVLGKDS